MRYDLSVSPVIEPVSEADLVAHCQLGELPDDQLGRARVMLTAARQWVENYLHRQLITATWKLYLDGFPAEIAIRDKLPVATISSVAYTDDDGDAQTLSSALYQTDLVSENRPARIMPAYGQTWPATRGDTYNVVTVTFTAGYGATRESVPLGIRHAILMLAADWYNNREDTIVGVPSSKLTTGINYCLQPFEWGAYY